MPHKLDEVRVLRNMGIKAPSPILHYYDWSRNAHTVPKAVLLFAQTETAAFLTVHRGRSYYRGLGSGKTLSSLWSYDYLRSVGERKRVLVVSTSPPSIGHGRHDLRALPAPDLQRAARQQGEAAPSCSTSSSTSTSSTTTV